MLWSLTWGRWCPASSRRMTTRKAQCASLLFSAWWRSTHLSVRMPYSHTSRHSMAANLNCCTCTSDVHSRAHLCPPHLRTLPRRRYHHSVLSSLLCLNLLSVEVTDQIWNPYHVPEDMLQCWLVKLSTSSWNDGKEDVMENQWHESSGEWEYYEKSYPSKLFVITNFIWTYSKFNHNFIFLFYVDKIISQSLGFSPESELSSALLGLVRYLVEDSVFS